jgi:hypothetical protein
LNRIILIGNGFDLAHKLKTSYEHFINDYWENKTKLFLQSYQDMDKKYFTSQKINKYKYEDNQIIVNNIPPYYNNIKANDNASGFTRFSNAIHDINNDTRITYKNDFLGIITEKSLSSKWVDIENEYYIELCKLLDTTIYELVKKLNDEFSHIRSSLYFYLTKLEEPTKLNSIEQNIYMPIDYNYFIKKPVNERFGSLLFLSFNYTNTENLYMVGRNNHKINHIHGEIRNPDNPIIFGYGDEIDEKYKKLEQMNNDYLSFIKSFMYNKTINYQNMLRFIYSDQYEVFIMGHSCGISDRTLLNTLFENENCLSIKIFYHQIDETNNNYLDLYMDISRNFTDKKRMREIIVPMPGCVPLS